MLFVLKMIPVFLSTNFISEVLEITISIAFPSLSFPLTASRIDFKLSVSKDRYDTNTIFGNGFCYAIHYLIFQQVLHSHKGF